MPAASTTQRLHAVFLAACMLIGLLAGDLAVISWAQAGGLDGTSVDADQHRPLHQPADGVLFDSANAAELLESSIEDPTNEGPLRTNASHTPRRLTSFVPSRQPSCFRYLLSRAHLCVYLC